VRHPIARLIALEYSAFAVDGRPDLGFVIYNPATPADAERIRSLVKPLGAKRGRRHRYLHCMYPLPAKHQSKIV